jgi:hypothetical protein
LVSISRGFVAVLDLGTDLGHQSRVLVLSGEPLRISRALARLEPFGFRIRRRVDRRHPRPVLPFNPQHPVRDETGEKD